MNKNRTCPPEFIGENRDPRRYPAPNTPPKPKFIDALEITDDAEQYSTPVKKDPKTGLLYSNAEHLVQASDTYHTAEEARLDAKIDEESKNRYAHVMSIDEVNQHRVNEEKAARESQDNLLGDRINRHEIIVNELHVEADRVHNSKLDKNFSNAEISTLPVSSSDYVVIVSNGNTYRVTLEQLAVLISQKTDYFKGQFSSLEHLNSKGFNGLQGGDYAYVDTEFTDSEGNTYYQFVTYVWDVEDARWEETKSSQYATQADYTALVQSLLDGSFNLGSIKANSSPEESPLLTSLHVNQKDYSLPSVELEFSDEPVEGGYNLGSINMGNNAWNIPHDMLKIKVSSEKIEGATSLGSITFGEDAYNVGGGSGEGSGIKSVTEIISKTIDPDDSSIYYQSSGKAIEHILDDLSDGFYEIQYDLRLITELGATPEVSLNRVIKIENGQVNLNYENIGGYSGVLISAGLMFVGAPLNSMIQYEFQAVRVFYESYGLVIRSLDGEDITSQLGAYFGNLIVTQTIRHTTLMEVL